MDDVILRIVEEDTPISLNVVEDEDLAYTLEVDEPYQDKDYGHFHNLPKINGITLIGNLSFEDLFPDGFVLDAGDADFVAGGD